MRSSINFFLGLAAISAIGILFGVFSLTDEIIRILKKIQYKFFQPPKLPLENERIIAELPRKGARISIEMAFNSRCTSDYDNDPKYFHWGMFDPQRKLSSEQIKRIVNLVNIPRFTNHMLNIQVEKNILTFIAEITESKVQNEWLMVESGMQQQAISLISAAFGVGVAFKTLGRDGVPLSNTGLAITKIKLDPMKPSYNNSYWSDLPPGKKKPWKKGNLQHDPHRNGKKSLIVALNHLKIKNVNGRKASKDDISQMLWAAKGRTPHFIKSKPWGMTIPTYQGKQDITSLYILSESEISEYINWDKNRPTHSLLKHDKIKTGIFEKLDLSYPMFNNAIIIATSENSGYALWEVGYQLLNLFLQAYSLDIRYSTILINDINKTGFRSSGIKRPIAIFSC